MSKEEKEARKAETLAQKEAKKQAKLKKKQRRRRRGDRHDARWVRDVDSMHVIMPYMLAGRTANEAVLTELIDLEAVNKYLEKKNAENPAFRYTMFHVVTAAMGKVVALRPKMNRFYKNLRLYQRDDISFAFVVKKQLVDTAEEMLAIIKLDCDSEASPIEQIHSKIEKVVTAVRAPGGSDGATDAMDILKKLPRFVLDIVMALFLRWDVKDRMPLSISKDDPYNTTCFISNLGSIKMNADYHHLAEWGTNSFFCIIGEKKLRPIFSDDGSYEMRECLPLSMTIDERIADGLYFGNSMKILRALLANPELLELPVTEEISC